MGCRQSAPKDQTERAAKPAQSDPPLPEAPVPDADPADTEPKVAEIAEKRAPGSCGPSQATLRALVYLICSGDEDAPQVEPVMASELVQVGHALDITAATRHAARNLVRVGATELRKQLP